MLAFASFAALAAGVPDRVTKIIGGEVYAGINPYMAWVGWIHDGMQTGCGGTVIAPQWVLTAAVRPAPRHRHDPLRLIPCAYS